MNDKLLELLKAEVCDPDLAETVKGSDDADAVVAAALVQGLRHLRATAFWGKDIYEKLRDMQ